MRVVPRVLTQADLPLAELSALRLRGELYRLGDAFSPVDQPDVHELRCTAMRAAVPPGLIVESWSAAWLWGAIDEPPVTDRLCVDVRRRRHHKHARGVRALVIDADERVERFGVLVTTAARTAVDIARDPATPDAVVGQALQRLLRRTDAEQVRTLLRRHPAFTGLRRAHARLEAASAVVDAVDVVDGVDAPYGVEHAVQMRRVAHLEHEAAERQAVA